MITVLNLNLLLLPLLLGAAGPIRSGVDPYVQVERRTYLMGTVLAARVAASTRTAAIDAIESVFAEVARLEGVLSSWTDESELGRANRARVGEPHALGRELEAMLREVVGWREATGGAFEPAVGALIEAWDLRGEGRHPAEQELARALDSSSAAAFELDQNNGTIIRRDPAVWIDSGAFGKGAALRAAARILRERGIPCAELDFGGQLLVHRDGRACAEYEDAEVGVAHPADRGAPLGWLRVARGSVATSGQAERYVEIEGERYGHILDPRTGLPVAPWGSVTVVAEDPLVADVVATALYVMGPAEGERWARLRSDVAVLFVDLSAGTVRTTWNPAFERFEFELSNGW